MAGLGLRMQTPLSFASTKKVKAMDETKQHIFEFSTKMKLSDKRSYVPVN